MISIAVIVVFYWKKLRSKSKDIIAMQQDVRDIKRTVEETAGITRGLSKQALGIAEGLSELGH